MRVIVLRPEPGAARTVARARAQGLAAEAHPLFGIEPLAWRAPAAATFDGLLLTSANAVREAGAGLRAYADLPVYAVGEATAAAATAAGLTVEAVGQGGVADLLATLPASLRLLHLTGEDRVDSHPAQAITPVAVYRAAPIDPPPTLAALAPAVLLVHSPRAGRRVAALVPDDRAGFHVAAISPAAAEACGAGWATLDSADMPTDACLLSLAARLCQHPQPK